jgi:hypothetical protein
MKHRCWLAVQKRKDSRLLLIFVFLSYSEDEYEDLSNQSITISKYVETHPRKLQITSK